MRVVTFRTEGKNPSGSAKGGGCRKPRTDAPLLSNPPRPAMVTQPRQIGLSRRAYSPAFRSHGWRCTRRQCQSRPDTDKEGQASSFCAFGFGIHPVQLAPDGNLPSQLAGLLRFAIPQEPSISQFSPHRSPADRCNECRFCLAEVGFRQADGRNGGECKPGDLLVT